MNEWTERGVARSLARRVAGLKGRVLAALLAAAVVAPLGASSEALAQRRSDAPVDVAKLMAPGKLPDMSIGKADAPVTIVEYASLSCGHCAQFHKAVLPEIKKKYIDTGKARLIFRDYPHNDQGAAGHMLARCAGPEKYFAVTDALFKTQSSWAFSEDVVKALFVVAKQVGFTEESYNKCLRDQALLDKLEADRKHAGEVFGVNATPTFFINGKRLVRNPTIGEFTKMIDPLLEKK
ncbi:MAG: DsbA family protein [Hyphomicrobiaceae bacterium]